MAKRGRKTLYNSKYHPKMAELAASLGKIEKEISKEIGISEVTLNAWKNKHPEFLKALKKGKKGIDDEVEASLRMRANGYSHPAVKIFLYKGKPVVARYDEYFHKDTTACIFWLKNRRPDKWREKKEIEMSEDVLDFITGIFSKKDKKIDTK